MKKTLFLFLLTLPICTSYSQEVIWEKTIGGVYSDYLFDMSSTFDKGFLLAGSSLSNKIGNKNDLNKGDLDYYLWKMDSEGEQEWQLSFGGEGIDVLKSIDKTNDMGYVLGGFSTSGKGEIKTSENFGLNDLWIIKINARGELDWEKSYGGNGDDKLVKIIQLSDGGYLVVATSNSQKNEFKKTNGYGGLDYWVLRLDKNGNIVWEQTYGGLYNDQPTTALITEDGFIIGGISNSPISGNKTKDGYGGYDYWILKLDANGNLVNQYVLGGSTDDILNEIILLKDTQGYVISGTTYSSDSDGTLTVQAKNGSDVLILKSDKDFTITDQYIYDYSGNEYLTSTLLVEHDEILLTGYKENLKNGKKSFLTFKINLEGDQTWEKEISTTGNDVLRKAVITKDGAIVLAGHSDGKNLEYKKNSYGKDDYWIVKLDAKQKEKPNEIQLEAYPNPTEGWSQIVINHEYEKGEVNIFDLGGRLLYNEPLKYDMVAIDLSSYPTGTYVVNIKTDVFNGSIKVIKK